MTWIDWLPRQQRRQASTESWSERERERKRLVDARAKGESGVEFASDIRWRVFCACVRAAAYTTVRWWVVSEQREKARERESEVQESAETGSLERRFCFRESDGESENVW